MIEGRKDGNVGKWVEDLECTVGKDEKRIKKRGTRIHERNNKCKRENKRNIKRKKKLKTPKTFQEENSLD